MTLEEAIKTNQDIYHQYEKHLLSGQRDAFKMSINALIFYRKLKSLNTGEVQGNFIGETED